MMNFEPVVKETGLKQNTNPEMKESINVVDVQGLCNKLVFYWWQKNPNFDTVSS